MKFLRLVACLAAGMGTAATASASTVWTLNATFQYNSTSNAATGTITLNPDGTVGTYDVTVSGTNTGADNEYTNSDSFSPEDTLTQINFYDPSNNLYLDLYFATSPFGKSSGTVNLTTASLACNGCSVLTTGTLTAGAAATPEPDSLALLGTGAGAASMLIRRRRRMV